MKELTFLLASGNAHKVVEIRSILTAAFPDRVIIVKSLKDIGFTEEIVENGNSFAENALIKAHAVFDREAISIADDSGLMVDALCGEPGIYSARFAGEPCNDAANNAKLLARMESVPEDARTARFVSVIACVFPDGKEFTVRGECPGRILYSPIGDGGFGYDPLFWYEPLGKTFAQLTPEEKNSVSHRARALRAFIERLKEIIEETTYDK